MLAWASDQFDKISQTVAPPPTDAAGRFAYAVQRLDEDTAMGCIAEIDPLRTVVNQARGWFPIHMACQFSMTRLIRLLMNQPGISVQQPDYAGCTPLHHACMTIQRSNGLEVVKLLINDYGADPCLKNSQGKTPYEVGTLDSIRQYLLPIQLQRETQVALDNGGRGLPPGIDLGGLRINRGNMAPPPKFGGAGVAPVGGPPPPGGGGGDAVGGGGTPSQSRYPATPTFGSPVAAVGGSYHMAQTSTPMQPSVPTAQPIARAPASMPVKNSVATSRRTTSSSSTEETSRYSRTGGSSLAIYSKYKADGFHSSSSDKKLQQKYGHVGASGGSTMPPPPSSGNAPTSTAPAPAGPNPFSGAGFQGSRYPSYGQPAAPAPVSGPSYSGMGLHTHAVGATTPQYFTPGATFNNTTTAMPTTPVAPSMASTNNVSSYMPPPPYSGNLGSPPSAAANTSRANDNTVSSPFATPHPAATTGTGAMIESSVNASNLFESPPGISTETDSITAAAAASSVGNASNLFESPPDTTITDTDSKTIDMAITIGETTSSSNQEQQSTASEVKSENNHSNNGNTDSDWVETVDPTSGGTYYFNSKTNETSWEKPSSINTIEETTKVSMVEEKTSDDWVETLDPSSGKYYYYNTKTDETSWEKPTTSTTTDPVSPDFGIADEQNKEENQPVTSESVLIDHGWVETIDHSAGKTYFYNSTTGETSWDCPSALQPETKTSNTTSAEAEAAAEDANVDENKKKENAVGDKSAVTKIEEESPVTDSLNESIEEEIDTSMVEGEGEIKAGKEEASTEVEEKSADIIPQDSTGEGEEKINKSSTLADDWTEVEDPSTGKVYYYNTKTQETSWIRPESAVTKIEEESLVVESLNESIEEETDTSMVEGEGEIKAGKEEASTAVEEKPADIIPHDSTAEGEEKINKSSTLADDWTEVEDPSTGKVYYYNTKTQETNWTRPKVVNEEKLNVESAAPTSSEGDESKDVGDGACGWSEVNDPNTDKIYYYNTETNETSWEKPISMSGSEKTDEISLNEQNDWVETLDPSSGKNYYYNAKTEITSWEKPACLKEETSSPQQDDSAMTTVEPTSANNNNAAASSVHPTMNQGENIRSDRNAPFKRGVERTKSAEETFSACPPGEDEKFAEKNQSLTPEPSKFDRPDFISVAGATRGSTATPGEISMVGTTFDSAMSPSEPANANNDEVAPAAESEGVDDSNEMEDGEMTDIPLSPDPVLLDTTTKNMSAAYNLPDIPNATVTAPAPAPATGNDMFAAIGMPPPPFSRR